MKEKLPSLAKVKRFLYADWALRVKIRDGFKCLLCGSTERLNSHHWHISDHHAHAARYCVDNGATLCRICHIRGVHQRADYFSTRAVYLAMRENFVALSPSFVFDDTLKAVECASNVELTTSLLRSLWDARRDIPVHITDSDASLECKGKKVFVRHYGHQRAIVGNTLKLGDFQQTFEVLVVTKAPQGFWRYTVRELKEGGK